MRKILTGLSLRFACGRLGFDPLHHMVPLSTTESNSRVPEPGVIPEHSQVCACRERALLQILSSHSSYEAPTKHEEKKRKEKKKVTTTNIHSNEGFRAAALMKPEAGTRHLGVFS